MPKPSSFGELGPNARVKDVAAAVVEARLGDVRRYEAAVSGSSDHNAIHDMRVAARRLRAALKTLGADVRLGDEVKRLQDALGGVRDVQVQSHWLQRTATASPAAVKTTVRAVLARLQPRLPLREQTLRREIERWQSVTVPLVTRSMRALAGKRRFGGDLDRRRLRKRLEALKEMFKLFRSSQDPTTAHRLRIEAKKLRYQAELFESTWPVAVAALLEALVPLQEVLGDLHDADVRLSLIEQLMDAESLRTPGPRRLVERVREERTSLAGKASAEVTRWRSAHIVRRLRRLVKDTTRQK